MSTPDKKDITTQNPEGTTDDSTWNGDKNWEKMFKDTQASFTKAQQEKVEMAKLLVETDPKNVEKIPDEKIRNKVLQDKWGVDNIEELKVLYPNALTGKTEEDDSDLDELSKLKDQVRKMEYYNTKTKTKDALSLIVSQNKDVVDTIPDFEEKIKDELKFISETLDPVDRMQKAFRLVAGADSSSADAYSIMQWVTIKKTPKSEVDDELLKVNQNKLRVSLGLKAK